MRIPFNKPYLTGREEAYVLDAVRSGAHCGNRQYAGKCIALLQERYGFKAVFLTPSCTAAMEMGALLAGLQPGDEVILPSYTFSSTANAVVLRGVRPVFCEIDPRTMNLDVSRLESLITDRTRMIMPIDYMGIPCDLKPILRLAQKYGLTVLQDAAQSMHSRFHGRAAGSEADLAAYSFHESKNFSCGEGGALAVNREDWIDRAAILQEKGTDRSLVLKGLRDKYSWVDLGSSFLLADILAAMLLAQLEAADEIVALRSRVTKAYYEFFALYKEQGCVQLPIIPEGIEINHHAFFVIFDTAEHRDSFLQLCRQYDIYPYTGYVPLHSSVMGRKFGYKPEDLPLTEDIAARIVRLPFYAELQGDQMDYCREGMGKVLKSIYGF